MWDQTLNISLDQHTFRVGKTLMHHIFRCHGLDQYIGGLRRTVILKLQNTSKRSTAFKLQPHKRQSQYLFEHFSSKSTEQLVCKWAELFRLS